MSCGLLYLAIYAITRLNENGGELSGEPGLLLFIVPGVFSGLNSKELPLSVALYSSAIATPLCLLLHHYHLVHTQTFWQEVAYLVSAFFWCGFGVLLTMLFRAFCCKKHHH